MATFSSTINIQFDLNLFECDTEEEYMQHLRDYFWEYYNIELRDDEVTNIYMEGVENAKWNFQIRDW